MSAHRLPALGLLAAFVVTAVGAWAAAGRRRGAPTIAGALFALQGGLHLIFSMAGSHPGDTGRPPTTHPHGMIGMPGTHATHGTGATTDTLSGPGAGFGFGTGSGIGFDIDIDIDVDTGMLAVHLIAALLCGLWLAHGEAAFFTLARAALAYAFTPLRPLFAHVRVAETPRRPLRRARRSGRRPHTVVLAHALSRRGPPRLSVPRATALGAHV
ncbi:hypothetical protein [Streptomyces sp. NPDC058664]|uniref:hypothetical protein n=1 Tax=unclassified Streptomyces TaxID=2593676 RepID=UPI00364D204A